MIFNVFIWKYTLDLDPGVLNIINIHIIDEVEIDRGFGPCSIKYFKYQSYIGYSSPSTLLLVCFMCPFFLSTIYRRAISSKEGVK